MRNETTFAGRLFDIGNYVLMGVFALICIYPFYYILIYSLTDPASVGKGVYFWPRELTFTSYTKIFAMNTVPEAFLISIARTVAGTALCIYFSSLFAYLVTKREMLYRSFVYRFVIATLYLNAGLIPWYLTMKSYGLKDNFLLYIIPSAINAFYIVLVKTYMESIPPSVEESAEIDGAGFMTIFNSILLPLSKPIVATIAVYAAVAQWNSWQDNYFLINDPRLHTIQLILYNYLNDATSMARQAVQQAGGGQMGPPKLSAESIKMTITVISIVPIVVVYPFLQRYFTKGILIGAVKG